MKRAFSALLSLFSLLIGCGLGSGEAVAAVAAGHSHARNAKSTAEKAMTHTGRIRNTTPGKVIVAAATSAAMTAVAGASLQAARRDGEAESRLIEIYRLIGEGRTKLALTRAEALVKAHPNFQLAQLVYGDLLTAHSRPLRVLGDVPDTTARVAAPALSELREESQMRLKAWRERPPAGTIPSQFLMLSNRNRHAIAVDASRSRLYLFENTSTGLKLLADYYISVGKSGIEKATEGDLRTPLGVYFITNTLSPKSLKDFYGSGALPINYPNPLDARQGRTGSGIWLHGTPPTQFARAPKASDGCVVMANPDLEFIMGTVEIRNTPVVIATSLDWVAPQSLYTEASAFQGVLQGWRTAKSTGNVNRALSYYATDFSNEGRDLATYSLVVRKEMEKSAGRELALKDLSVMRWTDSTADTMVVTFGEVTEGDTRGPKKRQYWARQGNQWKIFFEGVIG